MKPRKVARAVKARKAAQAANANIAFSPYRTFTREDWARLRADTPMTLKPHELEQLSGVIEELSVDEVEQIYLPMSRLLNPTAIWRSTWDSRSVSGELAAGSARR